MPIVEWGPPLEVGVDEIDRDHRVLVDLLNRMHDACAAEDEEEAFGVLEELSAYTEWHFAREESLMAIHGYEFSERHRDEHEELTRKVHDYINRALAGALRPRELAAFMTDWLMQHIVGADRHLGEAIVRARAQAGS